MRIVTFICDKCGYETEAQVANNQQVPRYLSPVGKIEVCDVCLDQVMRIINNLTPKNHDKYIGSDSLEE